MTEHRTEARVFDEGARLGTVAEAPIPMLLWCPQCGQRHVDVGEFATKRHHTHACQFCGHVWRPAIVATVGVQFLPGFKDAPVAQESRSAERRTHGQAAAAAEPPASRPGDTAGSPGSSAAVGRDAGSIPAGGDKYAGQPAHAATGWEPR